jgi:transposase
MKPIEQQSGDYQCGYTAGVCQRTPSGLITADYLEGFEAGRKHIEGVRRKARRQARKQIAEDRKRDRERFELKREPAAVPKRLETHNSERSRQAVLFTGLDCLPGQTDLF